MGRPLLQVKDAGFSYPGHDVFRHIGFEVGTGEIFCIIGPNGCGKTTLLDCLLGVMKLKEGQILLNGKDINSLPASVIAKQIAYVPQTHERTFPYRVMDIVLMGRAAYTGIFAAPSKQDTKVAERALDLVGMVRYKDRPYTQLSGGEAQLVMLARALAQETELIVMDEPTAHLDFKHELIVIETIVQLVKNRGISVIMATHFPNHAFYFKNSSITTRVALMNGMSFSGIDEPARILTEGTLRKLYGINAKIVSCIGENGTELKQIIPLSTVE